MSRRVAACISLIRRSWSATCRTAARSGGVSGKAKAVKARRTSSKVPRKPEPLGAELKTTGCALSGALLFIEICKGKETHAALDYFAQFGHTTATTLRLTKNWQGTGRVVAGDSWFASVKTAEALGDKGLFFVGDVKTATRRYPTGIDAYTNPENGAWATFTVRVLCAPPIPR